MEITIIPAKDKIDATGSCPLTIYAFLSGSRFKVSSGIRAVVGRGRGQFHPEKRRIVEKVTGLAAHQEADRLNRALNERLDAMTAFLERTIREQQLDGQLNVEAVKRQFKEKFFQKQKTIKKNVSLTDWIRSYAASKKGIQSEDYLRSHTYVIKRIEKYKNDPKITEVSLQWWDGYKQHLAALGVLDKPDCTFIRNTMEYAETAGEKVLRDYLQFSYAANDSEKIFHTLAEVVGLLAYYNGLPAGHNKDALGMYLFACHTGLRWSDVHGLKWVNIQGNLIDFSSIKGRRKNTLYMPAVAIEILDQQDKDSEYCFPRRSRQRTSKLIKDICNALKFHDKIEKVWFRGNTRHAKVYKKWELVSFHTARHTYAVLSLKLGVDLVTLQDNMGHSDPKTTRIYAKLTEKDRAQRTASAWDKLGLEEKEPE